MRRLSLLRATNRPQPQAFSDYNVWRWIRGVWALAAAIALSAAANAHRGHGVWTDVSWHEDRFEIIHQIHLADALRLLENIDREAPIESPEGLAKLSLYVDDHFNIISRGEVVTLDTLGAEIADDFVYVYQEWLTMKPEAMPSFKSRLLLIIEPSAKTYVRYEVSDINKTLILESPSGDN